MKIGDLCKITNSKMKGKVYQILKTCIVLFCDDKVVRDYNPKSLTVIKSKIGCSEMKKEQESKDKESKDKESKK